MSLTSLLQSLLVVVALACVPSIIDRIRGRKYPPGPRGLPLLGNLLDMPTEREWLTFADWGKKYGDIIHISMLGQSMLVLNSTRTTGDLLDKRGSLYSDRPRLEMVGELIGYAGSVPLCRYGPRHREMRKFLSAGLLPRKVAFLLPVQEEKTRDFLRLLLESPENFTSHIRHMVASIVLQASHGYDVRKENDPLIDLAEQGTVEFGIAAAPGAFLVDIIPALRHIPSHWPGARFKRMAAQFRVTAEKLRDDPWEMVRAEVAKGTARPSFTADLLETYPNATPDELDILKWTCTGFYSAGADTTVSAIKSFILAMTLHPEVQERAQAELDRVVGSSRLPSFSDRPELPFIENILMEVLRWNPVAPLAIPHRLMEDDVYEGYFIPAGTIIFPNTWAILHDEASYPKPFEFNPSRYDKKDSTLNPDPRPAAFGYGRRVCPGQHLAEASLWIAMTMTLAAFKISKAVNERGEAITPKVQYTSGTVSHPEPFKCNIVPRSPAVEALLNASK